jgi:hypothetical protein
MKFNLIWETNPPELTEAQKATLAREIVWLESFSDDASSVVSHLVNLTSDLSGPSIMLYGKDGNDADIFLTYNKVTKWTTLDDIDFETGE